MEKCSVLEREARRLGSSSNIVLSVRLQQLYERCLPPDYDIVQWTFRKYKDKVTRWHDEEKLYISSMFFPTEVSHSSKTIVLSTVYGNHHHSLKAIYFQFLS